VLAQAVMADHVHVLVSFLPERPLMPFIRDAKSESARRVNAAPPGRVRWARGYYAGSVSHGVIPALRGYLARQHTRHPDLVPI
jgi:REP element-mobilizing transposase RayT